MTSDSKKKNKERKKDNARKRHGAGSAKKVTAADADKPKPVLTSSDNYFRIKHLSLEVEGHDLIVDSKIKLYKNRRYALVGPTGSGKSTFLAAVGSSIPIPAHMTYHRLADGIEKSDLTVLDAVMHIDLEKKRRLEQRLRNFEADNEHVYKELHDIGPKARHRACEILAGFGFDSYMLQRKTRDFSDTWRMRIALARALCVDADILLLDNPTKGLDIGACDWLEKRLCELKKILLVVSNSQSFLANVCTDIIEIDMHEKILLVHCTKYDQYLQDKSQKKQKQGHDEGVNTEVQCDHGFKFTDGISIGQPVRKKQKQGHDEGVNTKVQCDHGFKFTDIPTIGQPVLQCSNVLFGYSNNKPIFEGLNLGIDSNSKIALVGPNGSGKSTLLKLLAGELTPSEGMVTSCGNVTSHDVISFQQGSTATLDQEKSGMQYMKEYTGNSSDAGLKSAGRSFGLSKQVLQQQVKCLSDGQRTRLILSAMALKNPQVLLLDEPTCHLDFDAVGRLAEGLNKWNGAVVIAGDDMRLINLVAQEIWECENRSVNKKPVGWIGSYQKKMNEKAEEARCLVRLSSTTGSFPLFSVGSHRNVAMSSISYKEYLDYENNLSREYIISLDSFRKIRSMTADLPCHNLKEGFLQLPGEIQPQDPYRVATEVSKKIVSSMLEILWNLDTVCGSCFSDFTSKNVFVTSSGEVKFRRVQVLDRSDVQVENNLSSARIILEDLFPSGDTNTSVKQPADILHLLDLMKHHPEKRELFHVHASLVPLSNYGDFFMRLYGCLHDKIEPSLRDKILVNLPHLDGWEKSTQSNVLLKKYFNHNGGRQYMTPRPVIPKGNTCLAPDQESRFKLTLASKFLKFLRNRVSHRMEHFGSGCRYLPDMADLVAHVRYPLINCRLQEELFDAEETRDLMLHSLVK